jgi:hypothetical protein
VIDSAARSFAEHGIQATAGRITPETAKAATQAREAEPGSGHS